MTPKNFRDKLDQQREAAAHHAAKTPAQILDLLREDETRNPKSHAEKTVVITDRGGESTTMAYGFFKDEAYERKKS